nr:hypothetical protein [Amylibacter sp.]
MSTPLISKIERGLEEEKLSIDLLRKALNSKDISERGIAYTVLSEPHLRVYLGTYKAKTADTMACLTYLLDCIKLDLDWDEDYANSREDALWELAVPLDPHWQSVGAGISESRFWECIAAFLTDELEDFCEDFAPEFLQAQSDSAGFAERMSNWKKSPALLPYVTALEAAEHTSP